MAIRSSKLANGGIYCYHNIRTNKASETTWDNEIVDSFYTNQIEDISKQINIINAEIYSSKKALENCKAKRFKLVLLSLIFLVPIFWCVHNENQINIYKKAITEKSKKVADLEQSKNNVEVAMYERDRFISDVHDVILHKGISIESIIELTHDLKIMYTYNICNMLLSNSAIHDRNIKIINNLILQTMGKSLSEKEYVDIIKAMIEQDFDSTMSKYNSELTRLQDKIDSINRTQAIIDAVTAPRYYVSF